jgi:DNA-binding CsgD family transcriptional regulator
MKHIILLYSFIFLTSGFISIILSAFYYIANRNAIFKKGISFICSFTFIILILNCDFYIRTFFMTENSFIYFMFFYLFLTYGLGMISYISANITLAFSGIKQSRIVKGALFIVFFIPLYILIFFMLFNRNVSVMKAVIIISVIELLLIIVISLFIILKRINQIESYYKPWIIKIAVFSAGSIPFILFDAVYGKLSIIDKNLPGIFYSVNFLYLIFSISVILYTAKYLFASQRNKSPAEEELLTLKITDSKVLFYSISEREKDIAECLLTGKTNEEIADEKYISLTTVKKHIYNLFRKTGAKNRVELINKLFR